MFKKNVRLGVIRKINVVLTTVIFNIVYYTRDLELELKGSSFISYILLKFGSAFWLRHINHLYNLQYGSSECGEHAWSQISNFDRLEAVFYISSF